MWSDDNFVAGHPALDFLNTVGDTGKSRTKNLLTSPGALMGWIEVSDTEVPAPETRAPSQDDLGELVRFRELAHRVLSASLNGSAPMPADAQRFEAQIKRSVGRAHLMMGTVPVKWGTSSENSHYWVDRFVLLLEEFLRSPEAAKLRQCEGCSWVFLNSGRGRGRRWCNMSTCGNRHKVAAHRRRLMAEGRQGQAV